eukprot:scaffold619_cov368-Pavlova_lutheri.AAC.3
MRNTPSIARLLRGSQLCSGNLLGTCLHPHTTSNGRPSFTRETNALAQEWASLGNLWAHLPCCLIDSVVGKLEAEPRALVTMIAQHWPKSPWFFRLRHLATYQEVLERHWGLYMDSGDMPTPAPHWDVLLSHVPRRMEGQD